MTEENAPKEMSIGKGVRLQNKQVWIRKEVLRRIKDKEYVDRLPNIHILAQEFNANYKTVNKALNLLAEEGVVYRKQGIGTVIKRQPCIRLSSDSPLWHYRFPEVVTQIMGYELGTAEQPSQVDVVRIIAGAFTQVEGDLLPLDRFTPQREWGDIFHKKALSIFTRQDALYALPISISPVIAYMNPSFFKKHSLAVPEAVPGFEEMIALQEQISDGALFMAETDLKAVLPLLWRAGLPANDGVAMLEHLLEDDILRYLLFCRDLCKKLKMPRTWEQSVQADLLRNDSVGMIFWGASLHDYLSENERDRLILLPMGEREQAGTVGFGEGLAIPKLCTAPDQAFEFIDTVLSAEVQEVLAAEYVPLAAHPDYRRPHPAIFESEMDNIVEWQSFLPFAFVLFLQKQIARLMSGEIEDAVWVKETRSHGTLLLREPDGPHRWAEM